MLRIKVEESIRVILEDEEVILAREEEDLLLPLEGGGTARGVGACGTRGGSRGSAGKLVGGRRGTNMV